MRALKPGDRVRINNKYGIEKKYEGRIFIVASEPWTVGSMQLVKLQGERGAVRVDGLEEIEDADETGINVTEMGNKFYFDDTGNKE